MAGVQEQSFLELLVVPAVAEVRSQGSRSRREECARWLGLEEAGAGRGLGDPAAETVGWTALPRVGWTMRPRCREGQQMPAEWLRLSQPGSTGSPPRAERQECNFAQPPPWAVQVSITIWTQETRVILPSGTPEATVSNIGIPLARHCQTYDTYPLPIMERSGVEVGWKRETELFTQTD